MFNDARINRRGGASIQADEYKDDTPVLLNPPRKPSTPKPSEPGARIPPGDRLSLFPPETVSHPSKTKNPLPSRPAGRSVAPKQNPASERPKYEVDRERRQSSGSSAPHGDYHRPRNAPSVTSVSSSGGSEPWFDVHEPPARTPGAGKGMAAAPPEVNPSFPKFGANRSPPDGGYTKQFESLRDGSLRDGRHKASTPAPPRSATEGSGKNGQSSQPTAPETVRLEPSAPGNRRKVSRDDRGAENEMGAVNVGPRDTGRSTQQPTSTVPIPAFGNWHQDSTSEVTQAFEDRRPAGRKAGVGSPEPLTRSAPRQWSKGTAAEGGAIQGQYLTKVSPEMQKYAAAGKDRQGTRKVAGVKSSPVTKKPESVSWFRCLSPTVKE